MEGNIVGSIHKCHYVIVLVELLAFVCMLAEFWDRRFCVNVKIISHNLNQLDVFVETIHFSAHV